MSVSRHTSRGLTTFPPRASVGDENRALGAALEQPEQEPGGARVPVDGLDHEVLPCLPAPPALDPGTLGLQQAAAGGEVQVLDVHAEDFLRVGARLVEHPPQRPLPQVDLPAGDEPDHSHF